MASSPVRMLSTGWQLFGPASSEREHAAAVVMASSASADSWSRRMLHHFTQSDVADCGACANGCEFLVEAPAQTCHGRVAAGISVSCVKVGLKTGPGRPHRGEPQL